MTSYASNGNLSQCCVGNNKSLYKIVTPALILLILVDLWFTYHNSKLHSWFALLAFFPLVALIFEMQMLIRFMKWMVDEQNSDKMNRV